MQKNLYKGNDKTSPNFVVTKENIMGTTRYDKDYTYNKDVQGSTKSVVGQDGSSTVAYDYDDFGVTRSIGDSTFFNEVCYTGVIYDPSGRIPFVIPIGIVLSEAVVTGLLHVGLAVIVSGTTYVVGSKIKNKKHEYYAVTLRNKRVYFGSSISKGTAVGI